MLTLLIAVSVIVAGVSVLLYLHADPAFTKESLTDVETDQRNDDRNQWRIMITRKRQPLLGDQRESQRRNLRLAYESGASIRDLTGTTGYSYGRVRKLLTESGVTLRGRGGDNRKAK